MNKYLVDVYLPALGEHYDVYLPVNKSVGEATSLLVRIVESLSNGNFKGTSETVLLSAVDGEIFNRNLNVYDAGIRNSSKLILI